MQLCISGRSGGRTLVGRAENEFNCNAMANRIKQRERHPWLPPAKRRKKKNQPGKVQRHQQAFLLRRRIQLNILMQINPLMSANSRHCREDRRGGCKDISWRNKKKMDKRTTIPREFPLRKLKLFLIQFMCLISGKSGDLTPEKR